MHDVCMMITCCISYLESPNAKIKLFTDKEVTNWINNKLKHKKYHEVLILTMEDFSEQEQNKKEREQEAEKTQPKKVLNPQKARKVQMLHFYIQHAGSMHTACRCKD